MNWKKAHVTSYINRSYSICVSCGLSMQCFQVLKKLGRCEGFSQHRKSSKSSLTLSSVPYWYYLHESTRNKATLVSETLLHEALSKLTDLVVNLSVFNNQFLIMKCSLILGNHKM